MLKCVPSEKDANCHIFEKQEPFTQSSESYSRIKESCLNILSKTTILLADAEHNTVISFYNSETIALLEGRFNDIVSALEKLSAEFQYDQNEYMVIGTPVVELLEQINSNRVIYSTKGQVDDMVESETIDTEMENIIHCILIPMQTIYKKYSKQKKILPSGSVPTESTGDGNTENNDLIEENHLKTKINYELLSELEILNVEKVTRKLTNVLLTVQYGKCTDMLNVSQKIIRILPILEQYHLFCKFFLIQQIGAHKVSTKMLSVMLTVFVELGSKVFHGQSINFHHKNNFEFLQGFCIPPDLLEDEDGESKQNEGKRGEGFGLDDGTGENDVSDK